MARYDFPDDAWALISSMLPPERGSSKGGRSYFAHRHVMNGIFRILCTGAPWEIYPNAMVTGKRFIILLTDGLKLE
ncbi:MULTISPECIES: transposase [Klebsiella]|uniref:transposase n=1 Tax=Klebsiella TaxID=570 RepID=UPI0034CE2E40